MQMALGMDTGDILIARSIPIEKEDTGGSLFDKLSILGGELVVEALPLIEKGELIPVPQDEDKATKCGKISKEMGLIRWDASAEKISDLVRALNPWPSSFTKLDGKMLKIWRAKAVAAKAKGKPGTISEVRKDAFSVVTGDGVLEVYEVQLEGKKRMDVKDFLLGYDIKSGDSLN